MDREEIIKALECCVKVGEYRDEQFCNDCPWREEICSLLLPQYAVALIRELTEENTRLQAEYNDLYESTTEEIERLKAELEKRPPRLIITKKSG